MQAFITIENARLHNLKNVTLRIPKEQFVVLSGLSGSGKSTLGFDILLMEGQRQYFESLGMLAFGYRKPPVDSISGLPPTISVDQYLTNRSPRSTVGTTTDIYTYLRVLYARLGHRVCTVCGRDVPPPTDGSPVAWDSDEPDAASEPESTVPCPHCGAPQPALTMASFSFNKPAGACPTCTGLGVVQQANLKRLVNEALSIDAGAVSGWDTHTIHRHTQTLRAAAAHYGFVFDPALPVKEYTPAQRDLLFFGVESPRFQRHFPHTAPPATVGKGRFEGVAAVVLRRYAEHIQDAGYLQKLDEFVETELCPDCGGTRLRPESRAVTLAGRTIVALSQLPLTALAEWLAQLPGALRGEELLIAQPILTDLHERVRRVLDVGVEYLSLERASPSLSTGEARRLRMATLLGSSLSGVLYVFDEPTIGLHARDTQRLVGFMRRLRDLGNTVLVIEHDLELIAAADYVVDFGPGAGKHGGQVVAAGTPAELAAASTPAELAAGTPVEIAAAGTPAEVAAPPQTPTGAFLAGPLHVPAPPHTLTGAFLAGSLRVPAPSRRRAPGDQTLTIYGARENNLQNITLRLPLGLLVAVTGVSGSGKSSLIFDILDRAGRRHFYGAGEAPGLHDSIEGWQHLAKLITIDQQHIGRMPRSNAATYSDAFGPIRDVFAATPAARAHNLTARHFSFNVPGGRCERCEGTGTLTVKMHFLADVEVTCPLCRGRRYNPQTLEVKYRDHDIAQVLELTVEEALALFHDVRPVASRLQVMVDVGLGYLQLGQPATTLSGGEAQRVKLSKELGRRPAGPTPPVELSVESLRRARGHTLYLLDEPTTGLHPADTVRLLALLQRLVDAGNTVIVVEHNLDLIQAADWVIDLGPEGGAAGGRLIAEGTPEHIAHVPASHTGHCLNRLFSTASPQ